MLLNISFEQITYSTYLINLSSGHTNRLFKQIYLLIKLFILHLPVVIIDLQFAFKVGFLQESKIHSSKIIE